MTWLRMWWVAARLAWPYLLVPWRSPLLCWRIETYGMLGEHGRLLHAPEITVRHFVRFTSINRPALARFLRWAAAL